MFSYAHLLSLFSCFVSASSAKMQMTSDGGLWASVPMQPRRQQGVAALPPMQATGSDVEKTTREHLERDFKVEGCDNIAYYCFKAYDTGRVCAKSDYIYVNTWSYTPRYATMDNYCMMDFLNCSEGFDVWKIAHLGACIADKKYEKDYIFECASGQGSYIPSNNQYLPIFDKPIERKKTQHMPGANTLQTMPEQEESERRTRTTMFRYTFISGGVHDVCEWDALICLRAYKTGILCARNMYYMYDTFKTFCEFDYVNCKLGYEMWMVMHMGECINNKDLTLSLILKTDKTDEDFLNRNYANSDLAF